MPDRDAMDIVMVDLCRTGGLTEGRKIAVPLFPGCAMTWHWSTSSDDYLAQGDASMRTIAIEPMSEAAFAPFGFIIRHADGAIIAGFVMPMMWTGQNDDTIFSAPGARVVR
jgi:hypothetical protein